MFVLRTGLQGNGKTLNTIKEVDQKSAKESRVVYYHNIREFNPEHDALQGEWVQFDDPLKWHELPQNSLIVIDEAQTFFRVRKQGSQVPDYASALETMRHRGHELHCITQNPGLIDTHFRKLCNSHIHYVRGHKGKVIKRWEFERCNMDVEKHSSFSDGESRRIMIDPKYFGVYKSVADGSEHHMKFKAPRALWVFGFCLLLLTGLGWKFYSSRLAPALPSEPAPVAESAQSSASFLPVSAADNAPMTTEEYVHAYTPRIVDVPASAPIYDQVAQPVTYPKPSCVSSRNEDFVRRNASRMAIGYKAGELHGCRCNSQQGSRLAISFKACMDIVENGYFDPAKPDREAPPVASELRGGAPQAVATGGAPVVSRVTVVSDSSRDNRPLTPVR